LSDGTCSYIRMYINAAANSVVWYLQHDFCNLIFKIRHKFYSLRVSPPPPSPRKISVLTPEVQSVLLLRVFR
jgi:hypothetical protein